MEAVWQTRKILKCICISLEAEMKEIRKENRSIKNKLVNEWIFIAEVHFRNYIHFSITIQKRLIAFADFSLLQ